jgi:hypothetical protein
MEGGAHFSSCGKYRYFLRRCWDPTKPEVTFIGLNPSTATGSIDDPTIRRCIGYAKRWGFGRLSVINLFALKTTQPKKLLAHPHPIGRENDYWIQKITLTSDLNIVCWGNHGAFLERDRAVLAMIPKPFCLKHNRSGQPAHPLYLSYSAEPFPFLESNTAS